MVKCQKLGQVIDSGSEEGFTQLGSFAFSYKKCLYSLESTGKVSSDYIITF